MPDCPAIDKCWQFYGEHQRSFVSAQEIEEKRLALGNLAYSLLLHPTFEEVQQLQDACSAYLDILNERWRNCVREPFHFPKQRESSGTDLLLSLGLLKPAEPIKRRL